jgi:hypothetical protein
LHLTFTNRNFTKNKDIITSIEAKVALNLT